MFLIAATPTPTSQAPIDAVFGWVQSPLGATIVGGLVVVGLVALFSRLPKIGPPVRKAVKWFWSWHPVTARRYARDLESARHLQVANDVRITSMGERADAAINQVIGSLPDMALTLSNQTREVRTELMALREGFEKTVSKPGVVAADETDAGMPKNQSANSVPLPTPRWSIMRDNLANKRQWIIRNAVPRSIAREVRIEPDRDMCVIDAGQWSDLSGDAFGKFEATVTQDAYTYGVHITIMWYDETDTRQEFDYSLHPESL